MNRERMQDLAEGSAAKDRLIRDAESAGYSVEKSSSTGRILLVKRHGGHGRVTRGLVLYPDGTAVDATLDLTVAKGVRSYKAMRRILGLTEDVVAEGIHEAYGDDPIQVIRNGMLGVARKRKYQRVKDKAARKAKVAKLVTKWQAALNTNKGAVTDWLMKKLD